MSEIVKEIAQGAKQSSFILQTTSGSLRNKALAEIANALRNAGKEIAAANREDMDDAAKAGMPEPLVARLLFDEHKLDETLKGIDELVAMPDAVGKVLEERELDSDLLLRKVTCPIGVIGVIFEARPDALVQIASLCIKSANAVILKGGSEAKKTNEILASVIEKAGKAAGLPDGFISLLTTRTETTEMLRCHEYIDLIVPRGSNEFVRYIMDNSQIPVMGHSDGICHVYVDKAADLAKAAHIVYDSKTQYVAACNAAETLLVHADIAAEAFPKIEEELKKKGVLIKAFGDAEKYLASAVPATEEDFKTEYLDMVITAKIVDGEKEAIDHINKYGSHHTDSIISEDKEAIAEFFAGVDSAGVYANCSTRFADGYRYGLGAEVGISTGKLHARGPVGIEGLLTYKYLLTGNGNVVEDYAEGRRSFHFVEH